MRAVFSSSAMLGELLQEPGVDVRALVQHLDRPAAVQRLEDGPHPPIGRHHELLAQRRIIRLASSSPVAGGPNSRPARLPSSSERMPLRKASLNVRPIAIASPTDFICVVSVRSASGNFSKFHRGIFTTM